MVILSPVGTTIAKQTSASLSPKIKNIAEITIEKAKTMSSIFIDQGNIFTTDMKGNFSFNGISFTSQTLKEVNDFLRPCIDFFVGGKDGLTTIAHFVHSNKSLMAFEAKYNKPATRYFSDRPVYYIEEGFDFVINKLFKGDQSNIDTIYLAGGAFGDIAKNNIEVLLELLKAHDLKKKVKGYHFGSMGERNVQTSLNLENRQFSYCFDGEKFSKMEDGYKGNTWKEKGIELKGLDYLS